MGKQSGKQVVDTVYAMHRAAAVVIERFTESRYLVEMIGDDLLATVNDVIADLYQLQVTLGIIADFHDRDLAHANRSAS